MKKIVPVCAASLLILIVGHQTGAVAQDGSLPGWVNDLRLRISQTFHVQATASFANEPDQIQQTEYFTSCIKGDGYLEKVADPFERMENLFVSDGWKQNERYQADGHGSSSFAYEKGRYFCLISVSIDSSCDDEEEGHVPSVFEFTIYCKEKAKSTR